MNTGPPVLAIQDDFPFNDKFSSLLVGPQFSIHTLILSVVIPKFTPVLLE